jgi:hypothetical protein
MGKAVQIMINACGQLVMSVDNCMYNVMRYRKPLRINDLLFNIINIIRSGAYSCGLQRWISLGIEKRGSRVLEKAPFAPLPLRVVEGALTQNFPRFSQKEFQCTN